jgi:predicted Zn-dependent protease
VWFGGVHGDRAGGMDQLRVAADRGHYLKPFAQLLLALAALREKQPDLARNELNQLVLEFPDNALFARELAKVSAPRVASDSH